MYPIFVFFAYINIEKSIGNIKWQLRGFPLKSIKSKKIENFHDFKNSFLDKKDATSNDNFGMVGV
jgi:hypothetical protein